MKRSFIILLGCVWGLSSCYDLDLNPLAQTSSGNWYSSETEIEMSVKDFYRDSFWPLDDVDMTDDYMKRDTPSDVVKGTLNGEFWIVANLWENQYKSIARANAVLANMDKASSIGVSEEMVKRYTAEALFQRASCYARLISHFGDVVYVTEVIDIDNAYAMGRTSKAEIIPKIYDDYDRAAESLPIKYSGTQRATKGAALALKARFALYMGDWKVAADAAKKCIDLGVYKLHPDYAELFLQQTKNSVESVFVLPRSIQYDITYSDADEITRNAGGWGAKGPSWELLAAYECIDGLPIDESPLFDPHKPFKNRDPRCTATIVEFNTRHLGFEYDPNPYALEVMNYNTGKMQKNNDTRANAQFASYNGLLWKKGIDDSRLENGGKVEPDIIIVRYADVLLMYAEAKMELNQIDQSVLDAINLVRARAYGVDYTNKNAYPAITTTDQAELREIIRRERRVEFVKEGLRYMDLVRWRIASKALTIPNYGILHPSTLLQEKVVDKGLWFWPSTPQIDEDGIADFSEMEKAGLITLVHPRMWNDRQYLWPIPTKEILINSNLKQNPGY